jgi:hypothetical protein
MESFIYTEKHHIIPRHAGGSGDATNLVELLPEEHALAHLIRYKAYADKNDFLSVRFTVNGYNSKKDLLADSTKQTVNKVAKLRKLLDVEFRETHGWHTEQGRKRISSSRTGMLPAFTVDGQSLGYKPKDHINFTTGEWVHHSKGKVSVLDINNVKYYVSVEEYSLNKHKYKANNGNSSGENNSRYLGLSDQEILNLVISYTSNFTHLGCIPSYKRAVNYYATKNIKLPKSFASFRFNGKGISYMMSRVEEHFNISVNPYPRGDLLKQINAIDKELLCCTTCHERSTTREH